MDRVPIAVSLAWLCYPLRDDEIKTGLQYLWDATCWTVRVRVIQAADLAQVC